MKTKGKKYLKSSQKQNMKRSNVLTAEISSETMEAMLVVQSHTHPSQPNGGKKGKERRATATLTH